MAKLFFFSRQQLLIVLMAAASLVGLIEYILMGSIEYTF